LFRPELLTAIRIARSVPICAVAVLLTVVSIRPSYSAKANFKCRSASPLLVQDIVNDRVDTLAGTLRCWTCDPSCKVIDKGYRTTIAVGPPLIEFLDGVPRNEVWLADGKHQLPKNSAIIVLRQVWPSTLCSPVGYVPLGGAKKKKKKKKVNS
jgi:hypothetical protein